MTALVQQSSHRSGFNLASGEFDVPGVCKDCLEYLMANFSNVTLSMSERLSVVIAPSSADATIIVRCQRTCNGFDVGAVTVDSRHSPCGTSTPVPAAVLTVTV
jgi:hypothetical protein